MFKDLWSKLKKSQKNREIAQTIVRAQKAVSVYGALLERYPAAILDVSSLPLPKAEMKTALQVAWRFSNDPHFRSAVEAGYTMLGQFQEGVESKPLSFDLTPGMTPAEVLDVLSPDVLERQKRSIAESLELGTEFDVFKQQLTHLPG